MTPQTTRTFFKKYAANSVTYLVKSCQCRYALCVSEGRHHWDEVRARQTDLEADFARRAIETGSTGFHESLFRAHAILGEVKTMLLRGDSPETIATFVEWAEERRMDE